MNFSELMVVSLICMTNAMSMGIPNKNNTLAINEATTIQPGSVLAIGNNSTVTLKADTGETPNKTPIITNRSVMCLGKDVTIERAAGETGNATIKYPRFRLGKVGTNTFKIKPNTIALSSLEQVDEDTKAKLEKKNFTDWKVREWNSRSYVKLYDKYYELHGLLSEGNIKDGFVKELVDNSGVTLGVGVKLVPASLIHLNLSKLGNSKNELGTEEEPIPGDGQPEESQNDGPFIVTDDNATEFEIPDNIEREEGVSGLKKVHLVGNYNFSGDNTKAGDDLEVFFGRKTDTGIVPPSSVSKIKNPKSIFKKMHVLENAKLLICGGDDGDNSPYVTESLTISKGIVNVETGKTLNITTTLTLGGE